jgi:hypothetical protein
LSSAEKYIELLKLQATSSEDPQVAKDAISTLELYGYKAVPALRDVLETCTNEELKELTADVLKKLGWAHHSTSSSSSDSSPQEHDESVF